MTQRDDPRAGRRRRAGGAEPLSRGEPRGERLSRERILEAAIGVVERDGVEGLSMRRLAQELDVWPMSVYRYFRDKEELLDAVAESAAVEVAPARRDGGPWRDRLRGLLVEARASIGTQPSGLAERLPRTFPTPRGLELTEAAMTILVEAGLPADRAASAWRALWTYTFGFATFRVDADPGATLRRVRAAAAALPEDGYPTLAAASAELAAVFADEDEFGRGLDLLLDGLARETAGGRPAG